MRILPATSSHVESLSFRALDAHRRLRERRAFLPERRLEDFAHRIGRLIEAGVVRTAEDDGRLIGYLGMVVLDDFRNAGPGAYAPDWAVAVDHDPSSRDRRTLLRRLYRDVAMELVDRGLRLHALSIYACDQVLISAMEATGFGRIVADAAVSLEDLGRRLADAGTDAGDGVAVRLVRADAAHAADLESLNRRLAEHIAASPVFLPDSTGLDAASWEGWLADPGRHAYIALENRRGREVPVGYIKAESPAFDVSYAVRDAATLGINGLYVEPTARRRGVARILLRRLVQAAADEGKRVLSVDFETTNLEAHAFWLRWFDPVTWSLERRV